MRDAVTLEERGIPTIVLVNDVFEPIALATAALLGLSRDYVAKSVVWLPHPTSNLEAQAAAALIDERIDEISAAFSGVAPVRASAAPRNEVRAPLEAAREIVAGLAASLRADGAELLLVNFDDGVLTGELRLSNVSCDDGACIMPAEQLTKMIDAVVRPKIASLREVVLSEIRAA